VQAPENAAARSTALMARLEAMALQELALAAAIGSPATATDPLLACVDWDLGVPGLPSPAA